ncbi:tRNA/tmRNA/rRNA uracil-C5-methylase (TrmA/RlmC/RlmD family) [Arthrobacter pigmenti]|uniref:tRNA/tmRNA/rRNA uracil-C5-methylase (TrmA/RlmC/RlmD family) n=1 Tax=Arthrobacter pigmenti TaxID=271432 RepID=A0A846RSU8_9MICC|nr:tRNA/tmRNA/rRNA uracil-C5-methylase (TrmA/RlmC/RlmD family) [Arthrobacter pigmenti]
MTQTPELELTIGPPAHGGHCVARHEGRVIFVRHALPGEVVKVRLTEYDDDARFWRADATDILRPSGDRVNHPWPLADAVLAGTRGTRPVGGAEFGHMDLAVQRRVKADIFEEQLARLSKVERSVSVEAVPDESPDGLGWRTRVGFAVDSSGHLAMHGHRSTELVPVADMPLAVPAINGLGLWNVDFTGVDAVEVAAGSGEGEPLVLLTVSGDTLSRTVRSLAEGIPGASVAAWNPESGSLQRLQGRTWVQEIVGENRFRVTGEGFWQIHRSAPQVLTDAVLDGLQPEPGQRVADLYAGAGLFTAALADRVGESGMVLSVEGSPAASKDARRNLHGRAHVDIVQGKVEKVLRERRPHLDAVVLDPPRAGTGREVVRAITGAGAKCVLYVSCDPASFARDVSYFADAGWSLDTLRVFDLYPHTHHMESVAVLRPHTAAPVGR